MPVRHAPDNPAAPRHGFVDGLRRCPTVPVQFKTNDEVGSGPPLHVHDCDEIFIIRQGRARFLVGDEVTETEAGDVLLGPAGVPHRFVNRGPGRLETTDVHFAPRWQQRNLRGKVWEPPSRG